MKIFVNSTVNNNYDCVNTFKVAKSFYPKKNEEFSYKLPSYNLYSFLAFKARKLDIDSLSQVEKERLEKLNEADECFKNEKGKFSLDKAADSIKRKIDSQLMLYSEDDIKNVVETVMEENPDVTRKDVLEVLNKLSSFSNYESLSKIENILKEQNISEIINTDTLTLNNIFRYYAAKYKKIINLSENTDKEYKTQGIIADRNIIEILKGVKERNPKKFESISKDIYDGRIKIIIPDGWEAKTKRGNVSYNVIGAWGDLADDVGSILKEQENVKNPFIDDIIQNLKDLYGDSVPFYVVENEIENPDENKIAKRLNSKSLKKEDIKDFLIGISSFAAPCDNKPKAVKDFYCNLLVKELSLKRNLLQFEFSKHSKDEIEDYKLNLIQQNPLWGNINSKEKLQIQELLSKILYCTLEMYSPRRMAEKLKLLNTKINTKLKENNIDEAIYIIPNMGKSFGLVSYQYSKVNNLPQNLFISVNNSKKVINPEIKNGKCFVCLDDFSGTGKSLLLDYSEFRSKNKEQPFIFAPLSCTKFAEESLQNAMRSVRRNLRQKEFLDCLVKAADIEDAGDYIKLLPSKKRALLKYCFESGFASGMSTVCFPHVVPDNCSDLAGLLFGKIITNELINKARMNYYKKSAIEYIINNNN